MIYLLLTSGAEMCGLCTCPNYLCGVVHELGLSDVHSNKPQKNSGVVEKNSSK